MSSSNEQQSTGVRKRQQILSTNKQVMIYVAGAAAIVTVCVMLALSFWQHISYQWKVISEWDATNASLKVSLDNIPKLRQEVEALSANKNIMSISEMVPGLEKWEVVFDVLPSSCDSMAVEYSFTNIIFKKSGMGATVKNVSAALDSGTCATMPETAGDAGAVVGPAGTVNPQPILMTVRFELEGATSDDIQKALLSIEYSLNPVTVQAVEIERGSAKISAVTYFVPKAAWLTSEKTIPVKEAETATGEATP
ncbi:hypothetical protein FWD20_03630 [Candidatus Saccharibacteria bacterium]|nr:hypothetical protein [Candidatus Saccharibacteria bacterium]